MSKKSHDERWGPHAHCVICGSAIPEGEKFCSEECRLKNAQELNNTKRQQRMSFILIVGMGGLIVMMFLLPYIFRP